VIGKERVAAAMMSIGYFISIPVFADSGFLLVSSLNKVLTKKAGLSLAATSVALGLGLTATHTMVPPTPGPVAATGILDADLGLVIFIGMAVSAVALLPAYIFRRWSFPRSKPANRRGVRKEDIVLPCFFPPCPSSFRSGLSS
jgi:GntP family gluconate:H+ symporter